MVDTADRVYKVYAVSRPSWAYSVVFFLGLGLVFCSEDVGRGDKSMCCERKKSRHLGTF